MIQSSRRRRGRRRRRRWWWWWRRRRWRRKWSEPWLLSFADAAEQCSAGHCGGWGCSYSPRINIYRLHCTYDDKEEEAVLICESMTKEHQPNAHQAQHRPKPRFDESLALCYP